MKLKIENDIVWIKHVNERRNDLLPALIIALNNLSDSYPNYSFPFFTL